MGETMEESERLLNTAAGKQWEKIGVRQHHGVVIPLFSLRSNHSCGIGEFTDLLPLLPWCKEVGLDVIQLLPLNDTGRDSSPYGAISAQALNPLHLGLSKLPYLKNYPELQTLLLEMRPLNYSQRVNYPAVYIGKNDFLREYYRLVAEHLTNTIDYLQFVAKNSWLQGYALFKTLKITHGWRCWEDWEIELRDITAEKLESLLKQHAVAVSFHIFVQYLCFQQWQEVRRQANAYGVYLQGDIPILINRDSADVWLHRGFFDMRYSAGAPPDMLAPEGQDWGFPTFNWAAMEQDGYSWWKERLRVASTLYHLFRIDHVVGFYRIWSILFGGFSVNGKFIPEDQSTWVEHGQKILQMMLENSSMLPIAEDLGTVPPEVRVNLNNLGICGTRVMRWERMWLEDSRFIKLSDYIPASMTTVSTHDSETVQQWWKNHPDEARSFAKFKGWEYMPDLNREQLQQILSDSHHTASIFHVNLLNEYLALIPGMTWPRLEDERINVPGVVSDTNWSYRFLPIVEDIVTSIPVRQVFKNVLPNGTQMMNGNGRA